MKIARFLLSKTAVTTLVIIAALIAFNAFNGKLQSENLAAFNEWYPKTASLLASEGTEVAATPKLQITIRVKSSRASSAWNFPAHTLADATDRSQTARILQLISESKVFGLPTVSRPKEEGSYVTIAVSDENVSFATTVAAESVENNIQLQNLLKLLEVFAATPPTPVNPAQL
jgi:hypothetical protein